MAERILYFSLFSLFPFLTLSISSQCTSIGVGYQAMEDGSAIATHNDDCNECDIRVTKVPAQDYLIELQRPVFTTRPSYPRLDSFLSFFFSLRKNESLFLQTSLFFTLFLFFFFLSLISHY